LKPENLPLEARHPSWAQPLPTGLKAAALPGVATRVSHLGLDCTVPAWAVRDTAYLTVHTTDSPLPGSRSPLYKVGDAGTALFAKAAFSIAPAHGNPTDKLCCVEPRTGRAPSWKGSAAYATSLTLGNWCVIP